MRDDSTLIVVADGAVARFLNRVRPGARLAELVDLRMEAPQSTHFRERPPYEAAEAVFLKTVIERISEEMRRRLGAELILCAPPRALGELRRNLPDDVRERLVLSWDRDLTKETPGELDIRLRELRVTFID
jgi:protein required for attachment to host cells